MFLKKRYFAVIALSAFIAWPGSVAAGDPLINLRSFFENLFRVQIDGPEVILRARDIRLANTPPSNVEEKLALKPVEASGFSSEDFSCDAFELKGFSDWREGADFAWEARAQAKDNRRTPDMFWPTFWKWNSPVFVSLDVKSTWFGDLRKASVQVAVLGRDFDISDVLSEDENQIKKTALEAVFAVRSFGYEPLYNYQIREKDIILSSSEQCQDFAMFFLEVE